jgi:hypothetical protein
VLGNELPKSRDRLLDPGIGHVGQWNRLAVKYAAWFVLWELRSTKLFLSQRLCTGPCRGPLNSSQPRRLALRLFPAP